MPFAIPPHCDFCSSPVCARPVWFPGTRWTSTGQRWITALHLRSSGFCLDLNLTTPAPFVLQLFPAFPLHRCVCRVRWVNLGVALGCHLLFRVAASFFRNILRWGLTKVVQMPLSRLCTIKLCAPFSGATSVYRSFVGAKRYSSGGVHSGPSKHLRSKTAPRQIIAKKSLVARLGAAVATKCLRKNPAMVNVFPRSAAVRVSAYAQAMP